MCTRERWSWPCVPREWKKKPSKQELVRYDEKDTHRHCEKEKNKDGKGENEYVHSSEPGELANMRNAQKGKKERKEMFLSRVYDYELEKGAKNKVKTQE